MHDPDCPHVGERISLESQSGMKTTLTRLRRLALTVVVGVLVTLPTAGTRSPSPRAAFFLTVKAIPLVG